MLEKNYYQLLKIMPSTTRQINKIGWISFLPCHEKWLIFAYLTHLFATWSQLGGLIGRIEAVIKPLELFAENATENSLDSFNVYVVVQHAKVTATH